MSPRASGSRRRRSRRKKRLLFAAVTIFIAGIAGASIFTVSSDAILQVAAAGAPKAKGQCQQQYDYCMKKTAANLRQNCENLWRTCVDDKCGDILSSGEGTQSARAKQSCRKDPDCELSCTEAASSQKGLLSCCLGGPKHSDPACPSRKKIDNKCIPPGKPFSYFGGQTFDESNTADRQKENAVSSAKNDPTFDLGIVRPNNPAYPEGTVFDENGKASNPPSWNAYNTPIIKPTEEWKQARQEGYYDLPPEYRRADLQSADPRIVDLYSEQNTSPTPLEVRTNQLSMSSQEFQNWVAGQEAKGFTVPPPFSGTEDENFTNEFNRGINPAINELFYLRGSELSPPAEQQAIESPSETIPPPSISNSTFPNTNTFQPSPAPTCRVRILSWCLW